MPLPSIVEELARQPRFWEDFFWETEDGEEVYPALEGLTLEFPVGGGYGLSLGLDEGLVYFGLNLRRPNEAEPVEVAWDDQAHWHPHVLRWDELDLIGRALALQDPALTHPGLPLLLLCRFAPVCVGDVDVIFPLWETAWRSLGALGEQTIDAYIERGDKRQGLFEWRRQEGLHSRRTREKRLVSTLHPVREVPRGSVLGTSPIALSRGFTSPDNARSFLWTQGGKLPGKREYFS